MAQGRITREDLFDHDYRPIEGSNPQQFMTRFTGLTDRLFPEVQEAALTIDPRVVFCVAIDTNGYLPTHNRKFSQPQRNDVAWNTANCRNRRIFDDRVGLKAGRNQMPFLLQVYRRDMGGGSYAMMKDVSAPIRVGGKHWGRCAWPIPTNKNRRASGRMAAARYASSRGTGRRGPGQAEARRIGDGTGHAGGRARATREIAGRKGQKPPGRWRAATSMTISAATPAASCAKVARQRERAFLISVIGVCSVEVVSVDLLFSFSGAAVKNFLRTFANILECSGSDPLTH
ncbi:hypothetical protein ACFSZS_13950 [Seohaeicola zhoushanensis]